MSPRAPVRIAYSGFSSRRPLPTTMRSPEKTGVGAVMFELGFKLHNSLPVAGSYPRIARGALVTSSTPVLAGTIAGVDHEGNSVRGVFQIVSPFLMSMAIT